MPGERIQALKNVTINEPFFQGISRSSDHAGSLDSRGHGPGHRHARLHSARAAGVRNTVYYLVGVDKARFKQPVTAGDQLIIDATLLRRMHGIYRFAATARVADDVVASAEFMTTERETTP